MAATIAVVGQEALPTCLAIRRIVFVEGQLVPEDLEVDGLDPQCTHFLASADNQPVGTARLWVTPEGIAKAQRVAVLDAYRGQGVGAQLMRELESEARRCGHDEVVLDAQLEAIPFYERLGYAAEGPIFLDAGIEHRHMRKRLTDR